MSLTENKRLHLFIIAVAVILAYLPSLSGGFLLDDHFLIEDHPIVTGPSSFFDYLNQEDGIVPGKNWQGAHTGYYRPLINLTYRLDFLIWGLDPRGYRATNLILHLLTCMSLYFLIGRIVPDSTAIFWAVFLFGLHPVQTESVSWVSSRNNILVTLFTVSSFLFHVKSQEVPKRLNRWISLFFFILALFSKEFAILLIPFLFLYHRWLARNRRKFSREILIYLPYVSVVIFYLLLKQQVVGSFVVPAELNTLSERIFYLPYLLAWYLRLVLFPLGLHNFNVGYPPGPLHWQAVASLFGFAAVCWATCKFRQHRVLLFSATAFLLSLFPVLNIVGTAATTLVSMRWLYFPMIFASLLLAGWIQGMKKPIPVTLSCLLVSICLYSAVYTHYLNRFQWHNQGVFYHREVIRFDNTQFAGGYAESLFQKGEVVKAETYFKMAVQIIPKRARHFINYSALLLENSRSEEALVLLRQAKSLFMEKREAVDWHNNMGFAHFNLKDAGNAVAHLEKAVALSPEQPVLWMNLGVGYAQSGHPEKSIRSLEKALALAPGSVEIIKKLAIVYLSLKNDAKVVEILMRVPPEIREKHGLNAILDEAKASRRL